MARKPLEAEALTEISRRCAEVFVTAGGSSPTVTELAAAAGMAERSFYRYFPTKADSLRPMLEQGTRTYAAALAAGTGADFAATVLHAFEQAFTSVSDAESRALMATIFGDTALRQVWLEVSYQAAGVVAPAVASMIGEPEDSVATTVASGQAILVMIAGLTHMVRDGMSAAAAGRAVSQALLTTPELPGRAAKRAAETAENTTKERNKS